MQMKDKRIKKISTEQTPLTDISRIKQAKHRVEGGKIDGVYSYSRSFGDFNLKPIETGPVNSAISVLPETQVFDLPLDFDFIFIATDGVYERLTIPEISVWLTRNLSKR